MEALQTWLHHLPITGPGHRSQQAANEQIMMDEKSGFWGIRPGYICSEESYSLSSDTATKSKEWDLPTLSRHPPPHHHPRHPSGSLADCKDQVEESRLQCFEICEALLKGNLQILPKWTRNRRPWASPTASTGSGAEPVFQMPPVGGC